MSGWKPTKQAEAVLPIAVSFIGVLHMVWKAPFAMESSRSPTTEWFIPLDLLILAAQATLNLPIGYHASGFFICTKLLLPITIDMVPGH